MENLIFCAVLYAKSLQPIIVFISKMNQSGTVSCQIFFPVTLDFLPTPLVYLIVSQSCRKSFKEKRT